MARKSKLSPTQWEEIVRRHLIDKDSVNSLAKEFEIAESAIRKYLSKTDARNEWKNTEKGSISFEKESFGYIYVIYIKDFAEKAYYKIGMAKNMENRIKSHQCSSPFEIKLACAYFFNNMRAEESYLHGLFMDKNIRGEWFDLSDEDLIEISKRALIK